MDPEVTVVDKERAELPENAILDLQLAKYLDYISGARTDLRRARFAVRAASLAAVGKAVHDLLLRGLDASDDIGVVAARIAGLVAFGLAVVVTCWVLDRSYGDRADELRKSTVANISRVKHSDYSWPEQGDAPTNFYVLQICAIGITIAFVILARMLTQ